ncbi:MAG: Type site-specific deoxyribonuclease [Alphaproteobacteria bacterium]|nr:Type site-specific deoxyribonuclease [Alphaproteobacteria bacterium]
MLQRSFRDHVANAQSLITSYEETRAGFISIALERNKKATPYIAEARSLKDQASLVITAPELLNIPNIKNGLCAAAGISDKAAGHLKNEGINEAIHGLIENFLEPAGANFVEELVYRFLLTRGDTLGGSIRNLAGALSQRKLTRSIVASLSIAGLDYQWQHALNRKWFLKEDGTNDDVEMARGISWTQNNTSRTLLYNIKVPLFKNNVDLCLLDCHPDNATKEIAVSSPSHYLALGELKGGIDPAGADERWKTARSALKRVREAFSRQALNPHLFFVGAAIEPRMAEEIWTKLQTGKLANAANLTKPDHISSLCNWLLSI